jgi:3-methyladenine DNA glycosylase/8-oxoguanine DNA glycosylase
MGTSGKGTAIVGYNVQTAVADIGLMRAIASRERRGYSLSELLDRANSWQPWRAYAAQHLWASA